MKEILYRVGLIHKDTEEQITLEVWAENCDKATDMVNPLFCYGAQYRWSGTGPVYENNEVVSRELN